MSASLRDQFLAHLTHLAKLAQVRKQQQLAFTFYRAMKQLKLHPESDAIASVDDLARVKGIGPFVLKHIANREKKLLERADGTAPPKPPPRKKKTVAEPEPAPVAAKPKRTAKKKETVEIVAAPAAAPATVAPVTVARFATSRRSASDPIELRRVVIEQCRRLAETKPIFVDTETTGFRSSSEIIEFAALDFSGSVLVDSLVQPVEAIEPRALGVHGISLDSLLRAPRWPKLWPQVRPILAAHASIGAYNAPFDRRLLRQTNARHGIGAADEPPSNAWFCVQQLMMRFAAEHTKAGRMKQFTLAAALDFLRDKSADAAFEPADVPFAHRALADAHNTRRLLLWIVEQEPAATNHNQTNSKR